MFKSSTTHVVVEFVGRFVPRCVELVPVSWVERKNTKYFCKFPGKEEYSKVDEWTRSCAFALSTWKSFSVTIVKEADSGMEERIMKRIRSVQRSLQYDIRRQTLIILNALRAGGAVNLAEALDPEKALDVHLPIHNDEAFVRFDNTLTEAEKEKKMTVANNLQPDERFTPKKLLEAMPRIKYIIDLTNTHRYYDQREFTDAGLKYLKIMVPGRLVPPQEMVKRFFKAMDDFMATSGPDDLIGVHCTHGVNRTGYFICRYLIQQQGWENQAAVTAFQEARGYPIERDVYVNDLKITRKGDKLDTKGIALDHPTAPSRARKQRIPKRLGPCGPMGPPGFHPSHRGFPNGRPFPPPHDHFGYGPPAFNPSRPLMPPMPPPHGAPYGPRPHRYGPPPGRGFPNHGFPPRMPPGPLRMPMPGGPPRLPPPGPPGPPLGPPGPMGPPRPLVPMGPPGPGPRLPPHGPPLQPMPPMLKGPLVHQQKKKLLRNGGGSVRNPQISRGKKPLDLPRHIPRLNREPDFTADTFEENLTTTVIPAVIPVALMTGPRRRNKAGRYNRVSRGK